MTTQLLPADGRGTVVTVGTFDGVHLGHRQVLEEIARRARASGRRSLLVTFEPHPLEIVNPQAAPALLTLATERREILAQCELDIVVFLAFTRELSRLTPREFLELLRERFDLQELVLGHDHGFGRGRAGNVTLVRELGRSMGFGVDVVDEVEVEGRVVSSTLIRRAIAGGDLVTAAVQLGRPYSCIGTVVPGAGRGRALGYPTVNIAIGDGRKLLPPIGVYAVHVEWSRGSGGGMMHLGPRPTFNDASLSLEAHVFTPVGQMYGEAIKLSWLARLRDVARFDSPEALKRQLDNDFAVAKGLVDSIRGHG